MLLLSLQARFLPEIGFADSDRYDNSLTRFRAERAHLFFSQATSTVNLNKKPTMR